MTPVFHYKSSCYTNYDVLYVSFDQDLKKASLVPNVKSLVLKAIQIHLGTIGSPETDFLSTKKATLIRLLVLASLLHNLQS